MTQTSPPHAGRCAIDTVRDWSQYQHQPKEQIAKEIPLLGSTGKN